MISRVTFAYRENTNSEFWYTLYAVIPSLVHLHAKLTILEQLALAPYAVVYRRLYRIERGMSPSLS